MGIAAAILVGDGSDEVAMAADGLGGGDDGDDELLMDAIVTAAIASVLTVTVPAERVDAMVFCEEIFVVVLFEVVAFVCFGDHPNRSPLHIVSADSQWFE